MGVRYNGKGDFDRTFSKLIGTTNFNMAFETRFKITTAGEYKYSLKGND